MLCERSFRAFYEQTHGALRAYVSRVVGNRAGADDIVQESYVRFLVWARETYNQPQMRAFLFRIASNLINDYGRQIQKEKRDVRVDPESTEAVATEGNSALSGQFARAFEQLSEQQRALLWLAYVEGYQHRQIAGMLNIGQGSVRVLMYRARSRLVEVLKGMGVERKTNGESK
ncbi:MAG TPA: RNA polymerase sigma factor [Candidatus Acidoferrum sp.]|nr:RNA polymerase sigma factor [Candidatus Acidoferrum sp.]